MSNEPSIVPRHLGIILDGNRRWAREQGLPVIEGHRKGFQNAKDLGLALFDMGIKYVSAYAFSTENWKRSKDEVEDLMSLFLWIAKNQLKELHKNNIRVRMMGSRERLNKKLLKAIGDAEELTKDNTRGQFLICLDYGGHQEIADAVKQLIAAGVKADEVTPELISQHLYTPDVPPVDLIIRTSGEQRLSNFQLWRAAYSELMFTKTYWPALTEAELREILDEYAQRKRRFGS